jgi:hypothetical protein
MMCIFLLGAGLCFLIPKDQPNLRTGLVVVSLLYCVAIGLTGHSFVYIFTIFYSFTEGPVAFQYSAEVFPTVHREQGMAWVVCIKTFLAGVLGLTFPPMVATMGQIGAFCFYAGLNALAFVGIFCLVPETKHFTLEELDQVFSVPRTTFIKYQSTLWLPYFIKRYVFFPMDAPEPPALIALSDNDEDKVDMEVAHRRASQD